MKLIVNADDFGYCRAVNYGIVDAHKLGVVTSATLMVNMPGASHAFELAEQYPGLGVGIHFVLSCGKPISDPGRIPSLVTNEGVFKRLEELQATADEDEIKTEIHAQLDKFFSYERRPTHIDSHHHVHAHPKVLPVVLELADRYDLPVRKFSLDASKKGIHSTDAFEHRFYGKHVSQEKFIALLQELMNQGHDAVEIMCHPGYVDTEISSGSSYVTERLRELTILTDDAVKRFIQDKDITLISYSGIKAR